LFTAEVAAEARWQDLTAFETCVAEAARRLTENRLLKEGRALPGPAKGQKPL